MAERRVSLMLRTMRPARHAWYGIVRGVAFAIFLTGCKGEPSADTSTANPSARVDARAVTAALTEMQLPVAPPGELARDSTWRVFIDTTGAAQLVLAYKVAALVLPDGPFELLAPLTYFQHKDDRWEQATQDNGGVRLSPTAQHALAQEFTDRDLVYFFRIRTVVLSPNTDMQALVAQLRPLAEETRRDVARWLKDGFISADAEP